MTSATENLRCFVWSSGVVDTPAETKPPTHVVYIAAISASSGSQPGSRKIPVIYDYLLTAMPVFAQALKDSRPALEDVLTVRA